MINIATLPKDLRLVINNEQIDLIIKAKRNAPLKKALSYFFFSFFWLLILSVGIYTSLKSHFNNKSLSNIITKLKNIDYTESATLVVLCFISIGLSMFLYGFYILLQKGGYFIATKSGLLKYRNGKIKMTDWQQFSGNIKVNNRNLYGDIAMELVTGKHVSRYNDSSYDNKRYVPDVIHIVGVESPMQIVNKYKARIEENSQEVKF